MNNIEISVIIPVFNAEKYIHDTLMSVINQTYSSEKIEIIVIDDNSTDKSRYIVSSLVKEHNYISIIHLEENRGAPAEPRNIGISKARGNYIAFLDADDIWHPQKLEIQMSMMKKEKVPFSSAKLENFSKTDLISFKKVKNYALKRITFDQLKFRFNTPTSTVVVKKKLIQDNLFNTDIKYKAREDLDCWLRCHEVIKYSLKIQEVLLFYRVNEGQISGNKTAMIKRHYYVMKNYVKKNGTKFGLKAMFYTFTHFFLAVYFRVIKKTF